MKSTRFFLVLLVSLGIHALLATAGCANTGRGLQQDYRKNEDKVENAVK